jgi:hypothetical protein
MKIKTADLTGQALDWAVERALGTSEFWFAPDEFKPQYESGESHYSTNWAQGGPIIEREQLSLDLTSSQYDSATDSCIALDSPEWWSSKGDTTSRGPTPLIAAMRCFVASRLGDEVDIPEELL